MAEDFRLIDLAHLVIDEVNELLDTSSQPLICPDQLREAAGSISANIAEAYGRKEGGERKQFLRYAHGSARETRDRLRASYMGKRISDKTYWRVRHRLTVITKMLESLTTSD